ncbi:unnamed protein product [Dibothriocephalus latus]|uniref:CULT domain-containing protein n=1 Tax=Dibothriocephalus latus TaxID=60516 RepID=A0A3P6QUD5_DIBLA|nr:unnamed protein product [Dibothriocephalus latus]
MACVSCRRNMSSQRDVICLAQEGSLQTYVNPHGIVFDMLTLSRVIPGSIELVGTSSTEYSWFPGHSSVAFGDYTNDSALFAQSFADLEHVLSRSNEIVKSVGWPINAPAGYKVSALRF